MTTINQPQRNKDIKRTLMKQKTGSKRFFKNRVNFFFVLFLIFNTGCTPAFFSRKGEVYKREDALLIGNLISSAYSAAREKIIKNDSSNLPCPGYLNELISDGIITIGLGIGTEDLGKVIVPEKKEELISNQEYLIFGKKILIRGMLILTKDDFQKALEQCEIIFVTSHSRFGAGPVFLNDGKGNPFKMQRTKDYEIIMPRSEVSGYKGAVKRTYQDPLRKKAYVVFKPDSSDFDRVKPFPGYQMIVLSTCTSKKHFLDEIKDLREGYPTTAIFTTRASCMDTRFGIFMRFLYEVFQGSSIDKIVESMNEEYIAVAWENVRRRNPPWKVIKGLYVEGR